MIKAQNKLFMSIFFLFIISISHINSYASGIETDICYLADEVNTNVQIIDFAEFSEGETVGFDCDNDGEDDLFVSCISIEQGRTRGSIQSVRAILDIYVKVAGISKYAATADMTLDYYSDGVNGYVNSLHGTATPHGLFSCDFDSYQIINTGSHTVFLNISGYLKHWQFMIVGRYNALDGTGSIGGANVS